MASSNSTCAGCRFLRRKCTEDCFLAPYFPADKPQRFACVHRVFGKSNIEKLLRELPESKRQGALDSLVYQSEARLRDPVYGCMGLISVMQKKLRQVNAEITDTKRELGNYMSPEDLNYYLANPGAEIPTNSAYALPPFPLSNLTPLMPIAVPMEQQLLEAQRVADARQVVMSGQDGRQVVAQDSQEHELYEAHQMAWAMADIGRHDRGVVIRDPQVRELQEAQQLAVAQQVVMSGHNGKQEMAQDPQEQELLSTHQLAARLAGMGGHGDKQVMAQDPMEQKLLEVQQLAEAQQAVMDGPGGRPRPQGRDYWEVQQQVAAQEVIMGEHDGIHVVFLDAQEQEYMKAQLPKQAIEESRQLQLQQQAMLWNNGEQQGQAVGAGSSGGGGLGHRMGQAVGAGSSGGGGLGHRIAITVHGGGGGGFHRGEASSSHQALFDNVGSYQMQQPLQQGGEYHDHHQHHHVPHHPPIEAHQGSYQMQQQQPQQGGEYHHQDHHVPDHDSLVESQQGSQQKPQQGGEYHHLDHHVPDHDSPVESHQGSNKMELEPQQGGKYHHHHQQTQQQKLGLGAGRSVGPCC